jgi:hypothetical protein
MQSAQFTTRLEAKLGNEGATRSMVGGHGFPQPVPVSGRLTLGV